MLLLSDVYSVLEREVGGGVSFLDPDKSWSFSDPINQMFWLEFSPLPYISLEMQWYERNYTKVR